MFIGYIEQLKAYQIYILGYHQIELNKDTTFRRSKKDKEDEEEHETPKADENPKSVRNKEEV